MLPERKLATQGLAQRLAPLGIALALGACASTPSPGLPVVVLPGTGKDLAAFHQDELICQQHAVAHTGYGGPTGSAAAGSPAGTPGDAANGASRNGMAGGTPIAARITAANAAVPVGANPSTRTATCSAWRRVATPCSRNLRDMRLPTRTVIPTPTGTRMGIPMPMTILMVSMTLGSLASLASAAAFTTDSTTADLTIAASPMGWLRPWWLRSWRRLRSRRWRTPLSQPEAVHPKKARPR